MEQVNKNWLAKVLVGTDAAVAALAFKAWWQPSFTVAANAGVRPWCIQLSTLRMVVFTHGIIADIGDVRLGLQKTRSAIRPGGECRELRKHPVRHWLLHFQLAALLLAMTLLLCND